MSLARVWKYGKKKLSIDPQIINAFNSGKLSRSVLGRELATLLTDDPLVTIEILSYLEGFRKLVNFGRDVIESKKYTCVTCGDPLHFILDKNPRLDNRLTHYLVEVQPCDCFEDYQYDFDTEIY